MGSPLIWFVALYTCAVIGLQTTRLKARWLFVMLGSFFTYQTLLSLTDVANAPGMSTFGPLAVIGTAHMITLLLIERYELPNIKSGKQHFDIIGAIEILANGRYIGTTREVPGLRRWPAGGEPMIRRWLPASLRNSPKWAFVIDRLLAVILIAAIEHLLPGLPIRNSDLHPRKTFLIRRLADVNLREVWLRGLMASEFVISSWLKFNMEYQGFAAISVGLGWHTPDKWPRLFGDFSELYSVRNLWSRFWHRLVYRPYGGMARLLLDKIPGLKRRSPVYWALLSFLVFSISGFVHAIVTAAMGCRCGWWADLQFYLLQFGGILFEEAVDYVTQGGLSSRKWLGHIWLFLFLSWSVPKLYLPHWKWNCVPL